MRILPLKWRRRRLWRIVCGVQVASLWLGLRVFAATPEPAAAEVDFAVTLRDMRAALREVSSQRLSVKKRGDAIKEACLYERQRAIAQAVDSTEEAQASFERAAKQGEAGREKAQKEQARAQKAAELVRSLVSAAEACVGEELRGGTRPTTVTVKGPEKLDDPKAGPDELVRANTTRLELPSRPNPASVFRPSR